MGLSQRRFERHHAGRAFGHAIRAGQGEQATDGRLIGRAQRLEAGVGSHVRVAIAEPESALHEEDVVDPFAVNAAFHRKPQHVR